MSLKNDINQLIEHQVIDEQTAQKIIAYYRQKAEKNPSRLLTIFTLIGIILVGAGILLILAHNWDRMPVWIKNSIAVLPLLGAQILGFFTLQKKQENSKWNESAALSIFFGLGIALSLITQNYHVEPDLTGFLFIWILLSIPLVYIFRSKVLGLLLLILTSIYGLQGKNQSEYYYWLFLFSLLPFYIQLIRQKSTQTVYFYHWAISFSILIIIVRFFEHKIGVLILMILASLYYLIGESKWIKNKNLFKNPYQFLGVLGTLVILIFTGFRFFWEQSNSHESLLNYSLEELFWLIFLFILNVSAALLTRKQKKGMPCLAWGFLIFGLIYLVGIYTPYAYILINILLLVISIRLIIKGEKEKRLDILNIGLIGIMAVIVSRFFDWELSFALRGILFVLVGIGFFAANYFLMKKQTYEDQQL